MLSIAYPKKSAEYNLEEAQNVKYLPKAFCLGKQKLRARQRTTYVFP